MEAPIAVFLLANTPYWFLIPPDGEANISLVRINELPLEKSGVGRLPFHEIKIPLPTFVTEGQFDIYQDSSIIVIAPTERKFLGSKAHYKESFLRAYGEAISQNFRNKTKTQLIQRLSLPDIIAGTANVLSAFREYTYYNNVSAWLYNDITETYTRISGDINAKIDYVPAAKSKTLQLLLEKSDNFSCIVSKNYDVPDLLPSSIQWVNLFRVDTTGTLDQTHGIKVVVCLYSSLKNYDLREGTRQLMKSFLQQHLANRYFDRLLRLTSLRGHIRLNINIEDPTIFLKEVAKIICTDLGWESCTIFLKSLQNSTILNLVANHPEQKKTAINETSYNILSPALTSTVFRENKILWSYNIAKDPRNTHTVDDLTETSPRNWLAVPIASPYPQPIGVLRVKNKRVFSSDDDTHFSSFDIHVLQTIASELASVLHQADLLIERKNLAEQRSRELSELSDFLRTFRHEIRSPIQAVCFAPERLGMLLRDEKLISHGEVPKKLLDYLLDFKSTGNRLEMISKALTLNPEEIVKDIHLHNIFKDCIAPVLAFTIPYASKKRRNIWVDKNSLLVNLICDAVAISMAFHVLVDNAIKYTDADQMIRVYGEQMRPGHRVVVESNSKIFKISASEETHIREKYFRGEIAKQQKLEGSGIGLYLADRIMQLHGGELALLKRENPVTFALVFKD